MSAQPPNDQPRKPIVPPTPPARPSNPVAGKPPGTPTPGTPKQPVPPTTPGAQKPTTPGNPKQPVPPTPPGGSRPAAKPPTAGAATPGAKPPTPTAKPKDEAPKKVRRSWGNEPTQTRKIGQVMVDLGFLDDTQLAELMEEARVKGIKVEEAALNRALVNEDQILQATAEQHGMKVVNLEDQKPTPAAMQAVGKNVAEQFKIVPLTYENDVLTVALSDPANLAGVEDLKSFLSLRAVESVLAHASQIDTAIKRHYSGVKEESILSILAGIESDMYGDGPMRRENSIDLNSLSELADAAPVRKLVNMILLTAIKERASDIHFEPFEDEYRLRIRAEGVLHDMPPPPRHLAVALSSRIKVMSNLDIAERRMPQDGRIELNLGSNAVDMRVSILPTMFGESVVIRVLDRTVVSLDLNKIGMEAELLAQFRSLIVKPNGIMLVTGPTGSGKTTTLYSALSELNEISDKIITTEDPVEYEIDGIMQVPIDHAIDFTFASALRAILRQDPDRILVGEIRDLETAQIAIQASLTGHMVFSTLHTNDAPSTITRLRDMGVEPYLLTATVEGILAQRLIRKICTKCRTEYEPSVNQLMELGLKAADVVGKKFYYGEGCDNCHNLGFRGRGGLYELIAMDDNLRDMISKNASTDQLRAHVRGRGVGGLREAGLRALFSGVTTIDEVVRETVLEMDD